VTKTNTAKRRKDMVRVAGKFRIKDVVDRLACVGFLGGMLGISYSGSVPSEGKLKALDESSTANVEHEFDLVGGSFEPEVTLELSSAHKCKSDQIATLARYPVDFPSLNAQAIFTEDGRINLVSRRPPELLTLLSMPATEKLALTTK
jgi:hypothetical protein